MTYDNLPSIGKEWAITISLSLMNGLIINSLRRMLRCSMNFFEQRSGANPTIFVGQFEVVKVA